jgi:glycosyltransferase involved in cell wall biosynthesis
MNEIRLAIFIESAGIGGAEKVVLELAKSLKTKLGHVVVITLRKGWLTQALTENNIALETIDSTSKFDLLLPLKINSVLKKHQINLLHSHSIDSSFYGALASLLSGTKQLSTEHGDVHHPIPKNFLSFKLYVMRLAKTFFCPVSDYTACRLIDYGIPKAQIASVKNPIILTENESRSREEIRQSLGIYEPSSAHWVWLHVANIRPVKDQRTLIQGFALSINQTNFKQTLIIIGDGTEREELEALCASLGISKQVIFLGFKNDVASFLKAADGFILSSLSEALPMALLEAACSGLVLISSKVGGVPEVIKDAHGFMFEAQDKAALSELILKVLSEPKKHEDRAKLAANKMKNLYSIENISNSYIGYYQKVLGLK